MNTDDSLVPVYSASSAAASAEQSFSNEFTGVTSSYSDLMTSISRLSMVVLFYDLPEALVPDTIQRFIEVDGIMIELPLVSQVLFHQQPQVEYLFSGTPL